MFFFYISLENQTPNCLFLTKLNFGINTGKSCPDILIWEKVVKDTNMTIYLLLLVQIKQLMKQFDGLIG